VIRSTLARLTARLAALAATGVLAGCGALLVTGAVIGTGLVVTDRRTTGTQVEDQNIEFKAADAVRNLATLGHVNVVSYNRIALITGEVPDLNEKARVERAVAAVPEVRAVVNELGIGGNSTTGSRSTDAMLGAQIKATLVDTKDLQANAYKVVLERGIVYLMGRVTAREADRGTEVARSVAGVQKVVRVFEIISEQELAALGHAEPAAGAASAPR
jgi:osmotically-inducible protein OsmY